MPGLAQRIRERREALNLSQEDLAERMTAERASAKQVSHWECERRMPSVATLKDLAMSLKCSSDWLLGLRERP